MNILDLPQPLFTTAYELTTESFVLAIRDPDHAIKYIRPLAYYSENTSWMSIDYDDVGESIWVPDGSASDLKTLDSRFDRFDVFKIVKSLKSNNKYDGLNSSITKHISYLNYLVDTEIDEFIEVIEGRFDVASMTLDKVNQEIASILISLFIKDKKPIYIENNEKKAIGPFIIVGEDKAAFKLTRFRNEAVYEIDYDVDNDILIEFQIGARQRRLIDAFNLNVDQLQEIDIISDKELLDWAAQVVAKPIPSELPVFIDAVTQIPHDNPRFENRYKRLIALVERTGIDIHNRKEFIEIIPNLSDVRKEIDRLELVTKDLEEKIKSQNDLIEEKINEVIRQEELIASKEDTINIKKEEYETIISNINKAKEEAISDEIKKLELRKNEIESELAEKSGLLQKVSVYEKIEHIDGIKIMKELEKRDLENNIAELKNTLSTLKSEFIDTQKDSNVKLREFLVSKTHFDFITNREFEPDTIDLDQEIFKPTQERKVNNELQTLINKIEDSLKINGREYESHFIANVLISIHQNSLTIFAGQPGTGKTSLAKLITSSLVSSSRICNVSVGRGWTSQKDLLGFSNPLTRKFHAAPTGVYQLVKSLAQEKKQSTPEELPMSFILLDEANLSPLEHYWSTFFGLTDENANQSISISLGNGESLDYSNNLRFIGTINIDQTTEDLSPRLLDRINLIRIDTAKRTSVMTDLLESPAINASFSELNEIFLLDKNKQHKVSDFYLAKEFNDVKEIFEKGLGIPISPRVENGIRQYCNTAAKVMIEGQRPLDYCIAQRLIPKINIQGERYLASLKELRDKIQEFKLKDSVSLRLINDIIKSGSEDQYFNNHFNYFSI